ncbi:hypothetical protein Taro_004246, partial [Colocasia esculenta]|nr:hypothetical protein [Colocasia esculenta]
LTFSLSGALSPLMTVCFVCYRLRVRVLSKEFISLFLSPMFGRFLSSSFCGVIVETRWNLLRLVRSSTFDVEDKFLPTGFYGCPWQSTPALCATIDFGKLISAFSGYYGTLVKMTFRSSQGKLHLAGVHGCRRQPSPVFRETCLPLRDISIGEESNIICSISGANSEAPAFEPDDLKSVGL